MRVTAWGTSPLQAKLEWLSRWCPSASTHAEAPSRSEQLRRECHLSVTVCTIYPFITRASSAPPRERSAFSRRLLKIPSITRITYDIFSAARFSLPGVPEKLAEFALLPECNRSCCVREAEESGGKRILCIRFQICRQFPTFARHIRPSSHRRPIWKRRKPSIQKSPT